MRLYFRLFLLLLLGCKSDAEKFRDFNLNAESRSVALQTKVNLKKDKRFFDSIYNCENDNYFSVLEEVSTKKSNAYFHDHKITITSKKTKNKIVKILNIRPEMSRILDCNDLYTVVGFPCGGPCYSRIFVFTDENRTEEQYGYVQSVKNNQHLITHVKNEEFENLILHNFLNNKEQIIDVSDSTIYNYGQMDSMVVRKNKLFIYYVAANGKNSRKTVDIKAVLEQ